MVGTVGVESMSVLSNGKSQLLSKDFDPTAVVPEQLPPVVVSNGGGVDVNNNEKKREIVLGRNVHTTCLEVTEPEEDDESTGDKEAYMASVLARYRKNLVERTDYHLAPNSLCFTIKLYHGGQFMRKPDIVYSGGKVNYIDYCECDKLSILELYAMGGQLGYSGYMRFYIFINGNLKVVEIDHDVLNLFNYVNSDFEIEMFMETMTALQSEQAETSKVNEEEAVNEGEAVNEEEAVNEGESEGDDGSYIESSSSCESMYDSDYDTTDDDELFDRNIDIDAEYGGVEADEIPNDIPHVVVEENDDGHDSDELRSAHDSDEEDNPTFPVFNGTRDMDNPHFLLGMIFSDHRELREAIKNYSIRNGKEIKFKRNEGSRVHAVCKDGCPWSIYASRMQDSPNMQIKTFANEHKCNRSFKNPHMNSKWLSKKYLETFRFNPKVPVSCFRDTVLREQVASVSMAQAYRARNNAMKLIEGSYKEQYQKLWGYMEEVKRTNPGTTILMKLSDDPVEVGPPRFERLYVCLNACKEGFKAGCRKFVGLDGCHLKGPHEGMLLAAIGVDANNSMFPIAYAVVEGETKRSWTWFIELLVEDIGIMRQHEWTFISDKQKGLVPAVFEVLPNIEHRFCVMHLYSNFKAASFRGKTHKELLWNAARASNKPHFVAAMKRMKEYDSNAFKWFHDKPPMHWSKSHFNTITKCDMLLNNICENFNKCILDSRGKSIIGLLEGIRIYLMVRLQKNRENARFWNGTICPRIQKIIEKNKVDAAACIPAWAGEQKYQISCMLSDQYTVELDKQTCSCGKWDLSGIPCSHAISAMYYKGDEPEAHVHQCYTIEAFRRAYQPMINPMNGSNMWPEGSNRIVLPPLSKKLPGRKSHKRKKRPTEGLPLEGKLGKKHQKSLKCGLCGTLGHNKRSCKKKRDTQPPPQQPPPTQVNSSMGSPPPTNPNQEMPPPPVDGTQPPPVDSQPPPTVDGTQPPGNDTQPPPTVDGTQPPPDDTMPQFMSQPPPVSDSIPDTKFGWWETMTQPTVPTTRVNIYHPADFIEGESVGTSTRTLPFIINEGKKFVTLTSLQGMVGKKVKKGKKKVTTNKPKN